VQDAYKKNKARGLTTPRSSKPAFPDIADLIENDFGAAGAERLAGVLGQCRELVQLNLYYNCIRAARAESLARVLAQCPALTDLNLGKNRIDDSGAESLAGMLGQCAALSHLDLSGNEIGTVGDGRLRASWRSAQRWLTSISASIRSTMSGKAGFELRGVVKPLALFFCRHLALLALCHLFSTHATRKSDILYTYSVVAFGLALSL